MKGQALRALLVAVAILVAGASTASAQSDRFVGVRKDSNDEVVLFALEELTGVERRIATLHGPNANVQLLGLTAYNAKRSSFSYTYSIRDTGKEYLDTVSAATGAVLAHFELPSDVSGIEIMAETIRAPDNFGASDRDPLLRRVERLEQEVRRLQSSSGLR